MNLVLHKEFNENCFSAFPSNCRRLHRLTNVNRNRRQGWINRLEIHYRLLNVNFSDRRMLHSESVGESERIKPELPQSVGIWGYKKHRKLLFLVNEAEIDTVRTFSLKFPRLKWSNFFILGSKFFVIQRLLPDIVTSPEFPWVDNAISWKIRSKDSQEAEQWKTRRSKGEKWPANVLSRFGESFLVLPIGLFIALFIKYVD